MSASPCGLSDFGTGAFDIDFVLRKWPMRLLEDICRPVRHAHRLARLGKKVLFVQPSIFLINQTLGDLASPSYSPHSRDSLADVA